MKKLLTLLAAVPLTVLAADVPPNNENGIKVMPLSMVNIPESIKKDIFNNIKQQKEKGYIESEGQSDSVRFLLSIEKNAAASLPLNSMSLSAGGIKAHVEANNEFKKNLFELKLSFNENKMPSFKDQNVNVLGYIGIGGYEKDDLLNPGVEGWSGVETFFTNSDLGSCSFSYFYIPPSQMAAELNTETVEYLVNGKPGSKTIEGNKRYGFSYNLDWFSKDSMNTIECANLKFDKQIMDKMIELANRVDKK